MKRPTALTIAGSDSGGGAGIQADLKTFCAFGVYGMTAVTAVTVQDTRRVYDVLELPASLVAEQIAVVAEDIGVAAAKTGMLANADIIRAVAEAVREHQIQNLVVDPVMRAKSGDPLLRPEAETAYIEWLLPLAACVTPNLPEAQRLVGFAIRDPKDMERAAEAIHRLGCRAVVVKGGHLASAAHDVYFDGQQMVWIEAERIDTPHTHGTGCTYSAAIAAGLAWGWDLLTAVRRAKAYVTGAIREAPGLGQGHGPLDHLWYGRIPFEGS